MIVRDEEARIGNCLKSVEGLVDEIIIVDTGSVDRTVSICQSFGASIISHEWNNDFAAARNVGLQAATGDWILWMDADEELEDELQAQLLRTLESTDRKLISILTAHYYGPCQDEHLVYRTAQVRLFRNRCGLIFKGRIHEQLAVDGILTAEELETGPEFVQLKLRHYGYLASEQQTSRKSQRNLEILEEEEKLNNEDPWILYHLASEYFRIKQFSKALAYVNQSILRFVQSQSIPPSLLYQLKYAVLVELRCLRGTPESISKAIEIYQDYVDLHYYKGILLYESERYEEAFETFADCIRLGESQFHHLILKGAGSFYALYYQGLCREQMGQLAQAKALFYESLQGYPGNEACSEAFSRVQSKLITSKYWKEGDSMRRKVLIASPVKQKAPILEQFLQSLMELQMEDLEVEFMFTDDNDGKESKELLQSFKAKVEKERKVTVIPSRNECQPYLKDEHTHYWDEGLVEKVAAMKDAIIEYALQERHDALFLVDSDLVLHPDTLQRLLSVNKDIVSNIFWTKWNPNAEKLPQVWLADEYCFYYKSRLRPLSDEEAVKQAREFIEKLRTPGVYEVGGLGACTLISRGALESGVRFRKLPNVSFWGEDRHFSIRAAALGYKLFVETSNPAYHIYRDSDLEGVWKFKQEFKLASSITISLCMIVKDEERSIVRCLSSVRGIADEIIIVDTGSTDRTKEMAGSFTEHIYDFEWCDDFAAARNFAFEQATQEYILWLDADDILTEADRSLFIELKSTLDPQVDSVMMNYHLTFDGSGNPTFSLKRNRLVKRSRKYRWIGAVHEYLEVSGHIWQSEIAVTHGKDKAHTDRNLLIYRKRLSRGEIFSPRDLYYFANELKDHALYEEAVEYYEKFLNTQQGWVEDQIAACIKQADCYEGLYDRQQQLRALFRSMQYDSPRAECCCRLGALFLSEERISEAIYWYDAATRLTHSPQSGTLVEHAAWSWLPHLQLCVCYDKLGMMEKAYEHNEKALSFHKDHPAMLHNKQYFLEKRLQSTGG